MFYLQYLSEAELEQVHQASLQLLERVGVQLTHPAAVELLVDHGARQQGRRILFPPELVMRCVGLCPPALTVAGRDGGQPVTLGGGGLTFHNTGGVPNVYDLATGKRRPAVREDNAQATRLLDALPNVDTITPTFTPQDVDPEQMNLWMYYDTVANTTKPVHAPGIHHIKDIRALHAMAQIAYPDSPPEQMATALSPISPLNYPDELVEAMLETIRLGWSFGPLPCPVVGQTAPMSLAGALAQQNAECLAGITLAQLAKPGLPVAYNGRLSVMEPRSGFSVWGNPEIGMLSAATAQLGRFYRLPVNVYGLCSSANSCGLQSGYERVVNALLPALAGADDLSGVGDMADGMMASLAQMVVDNEIVSTVRRARRGIAVTPDSLAGEVTGEVVAGPGNFLAEAHTVRYLRGGEMLLPRLARRDPWDAWEQAGRPDIAGEAGAEAGRLLATHTPEPLSAAQLQAMQAVIQAQHASAG